VVEFKRDRLDTEFKDDPQKITIICLGYLLNFKPEVVGLRQQYKALQDQGLNPE